MFTTNFSKIPAVPQTFVLDVKSGALKLFLIALSTIKDWLAEKLEKLETMRYCFQIF